MKMKIGRRRFLQNTAAVTMAAPVAASCGDDGGGRGPSGMASPPSPFFLHGVASGDPFTDSVVLWTRVTPQGDEDDIGVRWELSTDAAFGDLVASGDATASASADFTVKVIPSGLEAGKTYYYRFQLADAEDRSPVGRTRTLPTGSVRQLRLAFVSCSNHPAGFFHAYRAIGERADLDAVLHLGDYFYEYGEGTFGDGDEIGRLPEPNAETVTLAQYRTRFAQYRRDPDLIEAHRQHPWIPVWDDHETTNNAWRGGAENHQPETEGDWDVRVDEALQAYYEWLPIREPGAGRTREEIYRRFTFGDLADLFMLESRLVGRDEQVDPGGEPIALDDPRLTNQDRQLLGPEQEAWLFDGLRDSGARWKILGQQTMMAQLVDIRVQEVVAAGNTDQWDGYVAARNRLLDVIENDGVSNVVVLTGDIHSSWANDIARNPFVDGGYDRDTGAGSLAVEFVAPAVSSETFAAGLGIDGPLLDALVDSFATAHPHVRFFDIANNGWAMLDITRNRVQSEWYASGDVRVATPDNRFLAAYQVADGTSWLVEADGPVDEDPRAPRLAP
jgi:alkaline phosphatase D